MFGVFLTATPVAFVINRLPSMSFYHGRKRAAVATTSIGHKKHMVKFGCAGKIPAFAVHSTPGGSGCKLWAKLVKDETGLLHPCARNAELTIATFVKELVNVMAVFFVVGSLPLGFNLVHRDSETIAGLLVKVKHYTDSLVGKLDQVANLKSLGVN